jgi:hypothetical protein
VAPDGPFNFKAVSDFLGEELAFALHTVEPLSQQQLIIDKIFDLCNKHDKTPRSVEIAATKYVHVEGKNAPILVIHDTSGTG